MAERDDLWYMLVPAWDRYVAVAVRTSELPDNIRAVAHSGYRCYACVNIDEDDAFKIIFEDWEVDEIP